MRKFRGHRERIKSYRRRFKAKRYKKKKSVLKSQFFWDSFLCFILACLLVYFLFFSAVFRVKTFNLIASGVSPDLLQSVERLVKEEINKPFWHFFRKDSFFLVPAKQIEESVLSKYPQIKKVELRKEFPGTLILEIEKRKAVGIFCAEESACFLMDESGIIFKEFSTTSAETETQDLLMLFSKNSVSKRMGQEVMSKEKVSQVLKIHKELTENLLLRAEKFIFSQEELLTIKTTEGWEIYFDLRNDIKLALTKLKLLLDKEISQEQRKNLQYIDLRFIKVYYK